MKVLVILAFLLAGSSAAPADSCDNSFGGFLNALRDEMISKGKALETEFRDDYFKVARRCFATSSNDSSKCVLTDDELKIDVYGENGPMKGCRICQTFAISLRDQLFRSDFATRKCYRTHFAKIISEELEPCIQSKISKGHGFVIPPIPDICEEHVSDLIEQGVNARIAVKSRLYACKTVHPAKFQSTGPCMDGRHSGIYSLHRQVVMAAKDKAVSSSCSPRFDEVKAASCHCMVEKRDSWRVRFDKIEAIITDAKNASKCKQEINDVLGSWLDKVQTAISNCSFKGKAPTGVLNLRPLIELGCAQVIQDGVMKSELLIGFRFVRFLVEAINDRPTVYCDKNCS